MLWLLLACADLTATPEPPRGVAVAPVDADGLLLARPIVSHQPRPARFDAPLEGDLSAFVVAPWAAPPRMHVIDGLCYDNASIRQQVEADIGRIASPDDAWGDWTSLLTTCTTRSWCHWAASRANEPNGKLFQPGLSRCGPIAAPVFEGESVVLWSGRAWFEAAGWLATGPVPTNLFTVVDELGDRHHADPATLSAALRGWDHPEVARRLLALHALAGDEAWQVAVDMSRQSTPAARKLADEACADHSEAIQCALWWRIPGFQIADGLVSGQLAADDAVAWLGPTPAVRDALAACGDPAEHADLARAAACLHALARLDRGRAAALADAAWLEDDATLADYSPLTRDLDRPPAQLEADLKGLGFLQGPADPTALTPVDAVDRLVQHGDAVVLSYDRAATYLRRALWLAGQTDIAVDDVVLDGARVSAVHAWLEERRLRVLVPAEETGWCSLEQAVGLANWILADRGESRRVALSQDWPAALVVGEPASLAALPAVTGLRWRVASDACAPVLE